MEGGFLPESSQAQSQPPRYASASTWPQAQAQRATQPALPQQQPRAQRPAAAGGGGWADADEPPDLELEAQGGCSRCPSLTFRADWLKAFRVVLCKECSRAERLISKARCFPAPRPGNAITGAWECACAGPAHLGAGSAS